VLLHGIHCLIIDAAHISQIVEHSAFQVDSNQSLKFLLILLSMALLTVLV